MRISVFGLGYVGCVTMGCLAELGHRVVGVDTNADKVDLINAGEATIVEEGIAEIILRQREAGHLRATGDYQEAIRDSDLCLVCVATPPTRQGHLDLQHVHTVAAQIGEAMRQKDGFFVAVIRSTVSPGTNREFARIAAEASGKEIGKDFAVVSNPEFLREGSSVKDFFHPPMIVVGSDSPAALAAVREMYRGIDAPVHETQIGVAEIIKYVNNTYHALKVCFGNEVGRICKALGIDSAETMRIFCADTHLNISPAYFRPGFAYGGSCLPKDLSGMRTFAHDNYLKTPIIQSIAESNEAQKDAAFRLIEATGKKKVLVFGLSFKAGTDDLRNSPAVELVERLSGKGYEVAVYDENVIYSNLTGRNRQYIEQKVPHLANMLVHDVADAAERAEVLVIAQSDPKHRDTVIHLAGDRVVVDLVGLMAGEDNVPCSRPF